TTYTVAMATPAGDFLAKGSSDHYAVTATGCGDSSTDDFGVLEPSSVGGTAFVDCNDNGSYDKGSDDPLSGQTVTLKGTDDLGNPSSLLTPAAADGTYSSSRPRPAPEGTTYTVAMATPAGDFLAKGSSDHYAVTATGCGDSSTDDFGVLAPSKVSG